MEIDLPGKLEPTGFAGLGPYLLIKVVECLIIQLALSQDIDAQGTKCQANGGSQGLPIHHGCNSPREGSKAFSPTVGGMERGQLF